MRSTIKKLLAIQVQIIILIILNISTLSAQQKSAEKQQHSFIEKGAIFSEFSFSFINGSRADYNQDFAREITEISFQIKGLYFISEYLGIGPTLKYGFAYYDFENPFRGNDTDLRVSQFEFGAVAGWYLPSRKIFGGGSDSYIFVDSGIYFLRDKFRREGQQDIEEDILFGYHIGSGFLFPVGKQIAIMTKFAFLKQQQQYLVARLNQNGGVIYISRIRWTKNLSLSIGLNVTF